MSFLYSQASVVRQRPLTFSNHISSEVMNPILIIFYKILQHLLTEGTNILFLSQSNRKSGYYGNLQLLLTYKGKIENWHSLLSHCRYCDKTFTVHRTCIFLEWSSAKHIFFVATCYFDWLLWQPKCKICETILKINSSEAV